MSKNTFTWHFKNTHFFEPHIVTKEYFHKSFIRGILSKEIQNRDIKIVDNWASINDFFYKNPKPKSVKEFSITNQFKRKFVRRKKILKGLKLKRGSSIRLNYPILRHKFWHGIQLQVPIMPNAKPVELIRLVKNIKKSFFKNKTTKKKNVLPVRILKPKKGGFIVRFVTIKGFLPKKQFMLAKKALIIEHENLNPLNKLKENRKHFFDNNKFAHIFTYFKNPKLYLEKKKEFVLPYLNATKLINKKTSILKKYNILKEKTDIFKNFTKPKEYFEKDNVLKNKITLPLKFTNIKRSYIIKKKIFVKKKKLGKRRFFRRNFDIDFKKNKKFHKLHSTVFFFDTFRRSKKHLNSIGFKPKFKKHFKTNRNYKNKPDFNKDKQVFNKKKNFSKQK